MRFATHLSQKPRIKMIDGWWRAQINHGVWCPNLMTKAHQFCFYMNCEESQE